VPEDGEPVAKRRGVRDTYDRIAAHFAETRPEPWSEVADFLHGREGAVGLDIGVGNGRHAELLASRCTSVLGIDVSRAAISEAAGRAGSRGFEVDLLVGDATALPLGSGCVGRGVYVATLRHLPTRADRVASLDGRARVLRPAGRAIVSAWSVTHERFDAATGFDTTVDWTLPDGAVVERYYHIYDPDEFRRDVEASDLVPVSTFESHGNCYGLVGVDP
jgi:ubiquinone/menaquinone biosynthesis C-methylase UbiE